MGDWHAETSAAASCCSLLSWAATASGLGRRCARNQRKLFSMGGVRAGSWLGLEAC